MKRDTVFFDTSAWLAALSTREERHAACASAHDAFAQARAQVVTTNLVVAEMHGLLVRRRGAVDAVTFLDLIHRDPSYEIVRVDRDLEARAIDAWLRRYRDKPFSLTDAVSFEVMRERAIRDAFTLDRHFETAGYKMVPAP